MHKCGPAVQLYWPVIVAGPEALDIGEGTSIAPFVHVWAGGRVIIGSHCMIGAHAAITSLTHDYLQPEMHRTMVAKPVVIEDEVWIGSHAVILPGVTIGRGAVVGAGSVVTHDVPPYGIVVGIPARVKATRPTAPEGRLSCNSGPPRVDTPLPSP
ncbi:MAG: acyltransferase [Planctomycetes bacterium]|nr:acyltransferase [Planctomycetota bacterium]